MKNLTLYQIDAFASRPFSGNPAAVIPLDEWLSDEMLLNIAMENNLSETAFFIKKSDKYHLRWFTPTTEVDLCGHATLAASWVLFNELNAPAPLIFETRSGNLIVDRDGDHIVMDFPSTEGAATDSFSDLFPGATEIISTPSDLLVIYPEAKLIHHYHPDFTALKTLPYRGIIISAQDNAYDFISRFFGPAVGVPEDPVTGSAHCILAPYWSKKLGKTTLDACQVSQRGGEVRCTVKGNRVLLKGQAVKTVEGKMFIQ